MTGDPYCPTHGWDMCGCRDKLSTRFVDINSSYLENKVIELEKRIKEQNSLLEKYNGCGKFIEQAARLLRLWSMDRQTASGRWTGQEQAAVECAIKLEVLLRDVDPEPCQDVGCNCEGFHTGACRKIGNV